MCAQYRNSPQESGYNTALYPKKYSYFLSMFGFPISPRFSSEFRSIENGISCTSVLLTPAGSRVSSPGRSRAVRGLETRLSCALRFFISSQEPCACLFFHKTPCYCICTEAKTETRRREHATRGRISLPDRPRRRRSRRRTRRLAYGQALRLVGSTSWIKSSVPHASTRRMSSSERTYLGDACT